MHIQPSKHILNITCGPPHTSLPIPGELCMYIMKSTQDKNDVQ